MLLIESPPSGEFGERKNVLFGTMFFLCSLSLIRPRGNPVPRGAGYGKVERVLLISLGSNGLETPAGKRLLGNPPL